MEINGYMNAVFMEEVYAEITFVNCRELYYTVLREKSAWVLFYG